MSKQIINLTVNGEPRELAVEPHWTLLEAVREQLGLTGSKEGCGTGDCGACSMILREPQDERGRLVTSCLMLAPEADGCEVTTIEGIAPAPGTGNGDLHPVQQAFIDSGGVQCGFCTPGMIMAAKALLDRNPRPTLEDVRLGLAGNLCRCTGYTKIYEAVLAAAERTG
jgi:aerobic carbon-monoxide dehydrogenase small subunit